MPTVVSETRYIDNGGPYSITTTSGDTVNNYTVLVSTADTGVYIGPQSMGEGSSFPATVTGSGGIGGYPLTPNQDYTFNVIATSAGDDGLYATTTNTSGAVNSYLVTSTN